MGNQKRIPKRKPAAQLKQLKKKTDQELADGVLKIAFEIPTLKQCENRRNSLQRRAEQMGERSVTRKRCSQHHRCGRLGCPICRRRAQLATIIAYAPLSSDLDDEGGQK